MKALTTLSIALAATVASADLSASEVAEVDALFVDLNSYRDEYISYLASHTGVDYPTDLIKLYTEWMTYTDGSYSTLFNTMDAGELAKISNLETALPWYSTRLEPAIKSAAAAANGASTAASSSSEASQTSAATSAATTSAAQSSGASTLSTSVSASQSASASSSVAVFEGAGAIPQVAGLAFGASALAYMLY